MASPAPRQAPQSMADCPLFQAHRKAEFERLKAKGIFDVVDDPDHDAPDEIERAELLYRLGLDGRQQDRTSLTVWSGR